MKRKNLKPTGFDKLTPGEKEALLISFLNNYDPVPALKNEIREMREELDRLKTNYGSSSDQVRRYEYHCTDLMPHLNGALQKLDKSKSNSWLTLRTDLDSVETLFEELLLLTKNEILSLRAKGIAAFLMIEMYQDENLINDSERQKGLVHSHSLLYDSDFKELKSTVTKALKELPNYNPSLTFTQDSEYYQKLKIRENLDLERANKLYTYLQNNELSWQAKGLYLYINLYESIDPLIVSIISPQSNVNKAAYELKAFK